jgi:hypothetical protein
MHFISHAPLFLETLPHVHRLVSPVNLGEMMESIFSKYREQYITNESQVLTDYTFHEIRQTMLALDSKHLKETDFLGRKKQTAIDDTKRILRAVIENDIMDRILVAASTALKRCDKLSSPANQPQFVQRLFSILVQQACTGYLFPIIDLSMEFLPDREPSKEPESFFFTIVQGLNDAVQKLDLHFQRLVLPRMDLSPTVQSASASEKHEALFVIEQKIQTGCQQSLQASIYWINYLLKDHQGRNDFRPSGDDVMPEDATEACSHVTKFVQRQIDVIIQCLDGRVLDTYFTVFGSHLHQCLQTHIRRFTIRCVVAAVAGGGGQFDDGCNSFAIAWSSNCVSAPLLSLPTPLLASQTGTLFWLRDIKEYQEVVRQLHIPAVNEMFETMRSIANLFMVPPDALVPTPFCLFFSLIARFLLCSLVSIVCRRVLCDGLICT